MTRPDNPGRQSDGNEPAAAAANTIPERTHCEHCLTGEGTHFERWDWALLVNDNQASVELARDGAVKLTIPLTAQQTAQLMDGPLTMADVLGEGL